MRPPIAFIVGYGPGVGSAVARRLKSQGFTVAVASRHVQPYPDASDANSYDLGIRLDMVKPEDVGPAFSEVEEELGGPASLVVYNVGAYAGAPGGRSDPLSLSFDDFKYGTSVTGINAFQVAKHANAGFDRLSQMLPSDAPKAFVAVGNVLPWYPMPQALGLSAGKRVLANIVEASAGAYGPLGKRFYYAYEVNSKGGPVMSPDPTTHADVISRLYKQKDQGQWDVRFLKGQGI